MNVSDTCLAQQLPDIRANILPVTVFCLILVLVAFVYSLISRLVERLLHKSHPHLLKAVYRLYQELSVAALVSVMFLLMYHTCFDISLSARIYPHTDAVLSVRSTFHWLNLWIYVMFAYYGVFVGLQITWCIYRGRVWRNAEVTSASELRRSYEDLLAEARRQGCFSWINIPFRIRLYNTSALMRYHFLRIRYIQKHGLSERFSFADFLSQRLERECATAMRTHWIMWLTIVGMIFINLGRYILSDGDDKDFAQISLVVLGWAIFVTAVIIHLVFASLLLKVTDPETTYGLTAPLTSNSYGLPSEDSSNRLSVGFTDSAAEEEKRKREYKRCFGDITRLGLTKWLFQYLVFCQSFFLASLTMYAIFYAPHWGWGILAGLPSILLAFIPLPQVLSLYTLLTIIDHGPKSVVRDIQLTELLAPRRSEGAASFSNLMLVTPSVYEAPSYSSSLISAAPTTPSVRDASAGRYMR